MGYSDSNLLSRAIAGDEDALTALLRQHGPPLRARISAQIGKRWSSVLDADDVMQVTYLEAFLHIRHFEPTGTDGFAAWLAQLAKHNLLDAIKELGRAKRPQPEKRVEAPLGQNSAVALIDMLGYTSTTPSQDAMHREVQETLTDVLARLPEDYAAVVRLYDLEGQSAARVAASMGRSEGAVYMLRARAHDQLKRLMGSESQFFSKSP